MHLLVHEPIQGLSQQLQCPTVLVRYCCKRLCNARCCISVVLHVRLKFAQLVALCINQFLEVRVNALLASLVYFVNMLQEFPVIDLQSFQRVFKVQRFAEILQSESHIVNLNIVKDLISIERPRFLGSSQL